MLAKTWKKIGFIILIVACLYNVVAKLVVKKPFGAEIDASAKYVQERNEKEK